MDRFGHTLHDVHVQNIEFEAAGRALIGANFAFDDHARLLRKRLYRLEHFRRDGIFWYDSLDHARAITKLGE